MSFKETLGFVVLLLIELGCRLLLVGNTGRGWSTQPRLGISGLTISTLRIFSASLAFSSRAF